MEYIGVCLGVEDRTVTPNGIRMNLLRRNFDSNAEIYTCDDKWKRKFGRFLTVRWTEGKTC